MNGHLVAGSIAIDGHDVGSRSHVGNVGIAPADMAIPPGTTVHRYLALSFELLDLPSATAEHAAQAALVEAGVENLADRRTDTLALPERRVVLIAQALTPGVRAVFVETPLAGLEGPAARYVLDVLQRVAASRAWIATSARTEPEAADRELMLLADRVAILGKSAEMWAGSPGALMTRGKVYIVALRGDAETCRKELAAQGFDMQGGAQRFSLTLPEGRSPSELLAIAAQCNAAVIELVPVLSAV